MQIQGARLRRFEMTFVEVQSKADMSGVNNGSSMFGRSGSETASRSVNSESNLIYAFPACEYCGCDVYPDEEQEVNHEYLCWHKNGCFRCYGCHREFNENRSCFLLKNIALCDTCYPRREFLEDDWKSLNSEGNHNPKSRRVSFLSPVINRRSSTFDSLMESVDSESESPRSDSVSFNSPCQQKRVTRKAFISKQNLFSGKDHNKSTDAVESTVFSNRAVTIDVKSPSPPDDRILDSESHQNYLRAAPNFAPDVTPNFAPNVPPNSMPDTIKHLIAEATLPNDHEAGHIIEIRSEELLGLAENDVDHGDAQNSDKFVMLSLSECCEAGDKPELRTDSSHTDAQEDKQQSTTSPLEAAVTEKPNDDEDHKQSFNSVRRASSCFTLNKIPQTLDVLQPSSNNHAAAATAAVSSSNSSCAGSADANSDSNESLSWTEGLDVVKRTFATNAEDKEEVEEARRAETCSSASSVPQSSTPIPYNALEFNENKISRSSLMEAQPWKDIDVYNPITQTISPHDASLASDGNAKELDSFEERRAVFSVEPKDNKSIVKCSFCHFDVFQMDRYACLGRVYHRYCFRCTMCKVRLNSQTFCDDGKYQFCKTCYIDSKISRNLYQTSPQRVRLNSL